LSAAGLTAQDSLQSEIRTTSTHYFHSHRTQLLRKVREVHVKQHPRTGFRPVTASYKLLYDYYYYHYKWSCWTCTVLIQTWINLRFEPTPMSVTIQAQCRLIIRPPWQDGTLAFPANYIRKTWHSVLTANTTSLNSVSIIRHNMVDQNMDLYKVTPVHDGTERHSIYHNVCVCVCVCVIVCPVSPNQCKKYLNLVTVTTTVLLQIKNILIYKTHFYAIIYKS